MEMLSISMVVIYVLLLTFILFYSLIQGNLVLKYLKSSKDEVLHFKEKEIRPYVTIQLPIYNEKYVAERLIECVSKFDYPKDRFEIQVLDDSTDETIDIIAKKVDELQVNGLDVSHVRREKRIGYKAGALAYGTGFAKGEFIAIFDADFLPTPDFLNNTIPYFENENIGVVQTKWLHLNKNYSILTKLQAFGLDAHFSVEQKGRNNGNHFINFNGTAGVWRKLTIADAGGWQADTLTEDLDLSYRAQLKGWKFKYLENIGAPAELPAAMNALKTQQFRWTKGAAECAKKNLLNVLRCKTVSFGTKINAIFHLMNSFLFVCIILLALLSVPMVFVKINHPEFSTLFKFGGIYFTSLLILVMFYWTSEKKQAGKGVVSFLKFCVKFPLFLSFSMGLSLHNAIAVIEGYIGKKTPFVRTPKFNIHESGDNWKANVYLKNVINPLTILEGVLTIYFIYGVFIGFKYGDFGLMPFHLLLIIGFGSIFLYSIGHSFNLRKK